MLGVHQLLTVVITAGILSVSSLVFAQTPALERIVIAVQPTSSAQELTSKAKEIEETLTAAVGIPVELKFPTNYAGVIESLRFGHAQAAFMGAWPALLAVEKANAKVALAEVRDVFIDGKAAQEPFYFSYWVTAPDSPYQTLASLKGAKVAFPSQLSSSGYIAPLAKLVDSGLVVNQQGQPADPKTFFSEVLFAGGYAQGWEALKSKQVDVAIIAGDVAQTLYEDVLKNTKIVETQGPIPSHVFVVADGLTPDLEKQLTEAMMVFNSDEKRPLMKKFVSGIFVKFIKADNSHLESLKKMVATTGLSFTEKK